MAQTFLRTGAVARRAFHTGSVVSHVKRMLEVHRQRQALSRLSAHELADIGLSRETAQIEAKRPVWDLPCIF